MRVKHSARNPYGGMAPRTHLATIAEKKNVSGEKRKRDDYESEEERNDVEEEFRKNPKIRKVEEVNVIVRDYKKVKEEFEKDNEKVIESGKEFVKFVRTDKFRELLPLDEFGRERRKLEMRVEGLLNENERVKYVVSKIDLIIDENRCLPCNDVVLDGNRFNSECACDFTICNKCAFGIIKDNEGRYKCPSCDKFVF